MRITSCGRPTSTGGPSRPWSDVDRPAVDHPGRGALLSGYGPVTLRDDLFETICAILESAAEDRPLPFKVEEVAAAILADLEHQGEEVLEHLDPPVGLQRWLVSHGLVLVPLHEAPAPKVWEALEEEDDSEEEAGGSGPLLTVGGYVEYRTAPMGPRNEVQMGSGHIFAV